MQTFLPYEDFRASADGGSGWTLLVSLFGFLLPFAIPLAIVHWGATINATKVESKAWGFQFPGTHR